MLPGTRLWAPLGSPGSRAAVPARSPDAVTEADGTEAADEAEAADRADEPDGPEGSDEAEEAAVPASAEGEPVRGMDAPGVAAEARGASGSRKAAALTTPIE
ncbi:hypothetical protein SALCHL_002593 [Streptomyces albus subsp. chlorinus]|uniref:hypothetical protein n=1 Tax=Streptomyces albus TaxID=1888 RepID=UPI001FAD83AF|nr:hypothetical protein [Streptomyces albus]